MHVTKRAIGIWKAALVLSMPLALTALGAAQSTDAVDRQPVGGPPAVLIAQLPDSPGATLAQSQPQALPQNQQSQQSSSSSSSSSPSSAAAAQESQAPPQNPVGTAAAEPTHANGIAASQPAGVAVAPDKQRRARTIVIRVGAIAAAAIAVGVVVALSAGTSSHPPGAH
jgi:hypothetical protein